MFSRQRDRSRSPHSAYRGTSYYRSSRDQKNDRDCQLERIALYKKEEQEALQCVLERQRKSIARFQREFASHAATGPGPLDPNYKLFKMRPFGKLVSEPCPDMKPLGSAIEQEVDSRRIMGEASSEKQLDDKDVVMDDFESSKMPGSDEANEKIAEVKNDDGTVAEFRDSGVHLVDSVLPWSQDKETDKGKTSNFSFDKTLRVLYQKLTTPTPHQPTVVVETKSERESENITLRGAIGGTALSRSHTFTALDCPWDNKKGHTEKAVLTITHSGDERPSILSAKLGAKINAAENKAARCRKRSLTRSEERYRCVRRKLYHDHTEKLLDSEDSDEENQDEDDIDFIGLEHGGDATFRTNPTINYPLEFSKYIHPKHNNALQRGDPNSKCNWKSPFPETGLLLEVFRYYDNERQKLDHPSIVKQYFLDMATEIATYIKRNMISMRQKTLPVWEQGMGENERGSFHKQRWDMALSEVVKFEKTVLNRALPARKHWPCKPFAAGKCTEGEFCLKDHTFTKKLCSNLEHGGACVMKNCYFKHRDTEAPTMPARGYASPPSNLSDILDEGFKFPKYKAHCLFVNKLVGCANGNGCSRSHALVGVLCPDDAVGRPCPRVVHYKNKCPLIHKSTNECPIRRQSEECDCPNDLLYLHPKEHFGPPATTKSKVGNSPSLANYGTVDIAIDDQGRTERLPALNIQWLSAERKCSDEAAHQPQKGPLQPSPPNNTLGPGAGSKRPQPEATTQNHRFAMGPPTKRHQLDRLDKAPTGLQHTQNQHPQAPPTPSWGQEPMVRTKLQPKGHEQRRLASGNIGAANRMQLAGGNTIQQQCVKALQNQASLGKKQKRKYQAGDEAALNDDSHPFGARRMQPTPVAAAMLQAHREKLNSQRRNL